MENVTEQQYLELAKESKEIVEKKNEKIKHLSKLILQIYGLVRTMDNEEDLSFIEIIRTILSEEVENMLNL